MKRRLPERTAGDDREIAAATRLPHPHRLATVGVVVAAVVYYAIFIWKTSFVIGPTRYFSLFEDAMVSMRYARHLASGHGLTWNVGEPPIEGITNPLWTIVMAAVHLTPLPPHQISLAVQLIGVVILVALLFVVREACERILASRAGACPPSSAGRDAAPRSLSVVAMILVAFYYPLIYWTVLGMEVGLLAWLTAFAAAILLAGRSGPWFYALLAGGTFVRMDYAVVVVAFVGLAAILDRPRAIRHLQLGIGGLVVALVIQTVARWLYFHDPLPNTYYLKLTGYPPGLRVVRGAWVLLQTLAQSYGLLGLLPIAGLLLARHSERRLLFTLLAPFAILCLYSIWVGGDAWEGIVACNRYLAVGVPLVLVVAAWPISALAARVRLGRFELPCAVALALAAALAISPYRATVFLDPPAYVRDNAHLTAIGLAARELTRDGASVAAAAVGAVGYYSERKIVDLLGKSDRHVARRLMRRAGEQNPMTFFLPGHLKWDYAYSIGVLRPDVIGQLWWSPREAERHLQDYEDVAVVIGRDTLALLVRRDSPLIKSPEPEAFAPDPTTPRHQR
ncbi:MAG TPA: hypothetical protein VEY91_08345 [Candidatus Limnocylindria bacterium]|nr:hypothetical protein [Candidatus Limnocylindria bacterium]